MCTTINVPVFHQSVLIGGQIEEFGQFIRTVNSPPPPATPPQNFSWVFGKMGCLGNSKTEDQRNEEKAQREANKKIEKQLQKDKQIYRATHRLLLLGRLG